MIGLNVSSRLLAVRFNILPQLAVNSNAAMVCQHDTLLIVLSILVSILAAGTARELAWRIDLRCQRFGEPAGSKPDSL